MGVRFPRLLASVTTSNSRSLRHAPVQHRDVVVVRTQMAERGGSVSDSVDDVPVLLQASLENRAQRGIVLSHEDPHRLRQQRCDTENQARGCDCQPAPGQPSSSLQVRTVRCCAPWTTCLTALVRPSSRPAICHDARQERAFTDGAGAGTGPHQAPDQHCDRRGRRCHRIHLGHGGQGAPGVLRRRQGTRSFTGSDHGTSGNAGPGCVHHDDHDHARRPRRRPRLAQPTSRPTTSPPATTTTTTSPPTTTTTQPVVTSGGTSR